MVQKSAQTVDFAIGAYVTGDARGIRSAPYSVNTATNPLTYASLQRLNQVHGQFASPFLPPFLPPFPPLLSLPPSPPSLPTS